MVAGNEAINLLLLHLHVLLLLLDCHDEAAVCRQLILTFGLLQATLTMPLLVLPLDLSVGAGRLRVTCVLVSLVAASGTEMRSTDAAATQVLARLLSALARRLGALAGGLLLAQLQSTLRLVAHARAGSQLVDAGGALSGLSALARNHVALTARIANGSFVGSRSRLSTSIDATRLVRQVQLIGSLVVRI